MVERPGRNKPPVRPRRKLVEGRTVVVCKEKHGTRYYVVESEKELFRLSLNVLRGRLKSGHFYHEPPGRPAPPDFRAEDIPGMPASLREAATRQWGRYTTDMRDWERSVDQWTKVNRAASEADGSLAWEVLRERSDHEYESVALEPAEGLEYRY